MGCGCTRSNILQTQLAFVGTLVPGNTVLINGVSTLIATISIIGYSVTINGTTYSVIAIT